MKARSGQRCRLPRIEELVRVDTTATDLPSLRAQTNFIGLSGVVPKRPADRPRISGPLGRCEIPWAGASGMPARHPATAGSRWSAWSTTSDPSRPVRKRDLTAYYVPLAQSEAREVSILIRTRNDARDAIPGAMRALRAIRGGPRVFQVHTATEIMDMEAIGIRVPAMLFALCGLSGLLPSSGARQPLRLTAMAACGERHRRRHHGVRRTRRNRHSAASHRVRD